MSNTAGGALADYTPARPVIGVNSIGAITHGGRVCRVVLRRGLIQVGCTDVTIEAARELLRQYDLKFGEPEQVVVLQP